jgi:hypothetical protein
MKAIIVKRARACSIAVAILLCAIETLVAQPRTGLALNKNAFAFAAQLIKEKHFIADGKERGASIGRLQTKRTNSSDCTDSANMQNGIWGLTIITRRIPSKDTSSPMAISKMFIGAGCSRRRPELANMATPKSKTRRRNWNRQ